ncbi:ATP-binding protein [uncultured Shewanella sp.]|uniref:ATP-binding protein n=1 Tax=uncultured Shewanella sp. TaxID=173975 RepID=UPI00261D97E4|nr:ATP-binding protein [uncultured Shewanella sp.]
MLNDKMITMTKRSVEPQTILQPNTQPHSQANTLEHCHTHSHSHSQAQAQAQAQTLTDPQDTSLVEANVEPVIPLHRHSASANAQKTSFDENRGSGPEAEPNTEHNTVHSPASTFTANARDLTRELTWCERVIDWRFKQYFTPETEANNEGPSMVDHAAVYESVQHIPLPNVSRSQSAYGRFIEHHSPEFVGRLMLALALAAEVKPQLLDVFLIHNEQTHKPYTEFGLVEHNEGLYASGETLAFLVGADDIIQRFEVQAYLELKRLELKHLGVNQAPSWDFKHKAEESWPLVASPLPVMKAPLALIPELLALFTTGLDYQPELSVDFPAKRVEAELDWSDLVLPSSVMTQLDEIQAWAEYGTQLMNDWGLGGKIRPGYRALFHGAPGTGKTLTAGLLGKRLGRSVYKIDLSMTVSKYIGETEKNLEKVFSMAENKYWILFFDEADALFGKRMQASNANDQFANQNVAYLLQRMEAFNGLVLLGSNYKENMDEAFFRRFESIIHFPLPNIDQRLRVWQQGFSSQSHLAADIDLQRIATEHSLSAASIMNVIRYVSLMALSRGRYDITQADLMAGIRRETLPFSASRW